MAGGVVVINIGDVAVLAVDSDAIFSVVVIGVLAAVCDSVMNVVGVGLVVVSVTRRATDRRLHESYTFRTLTYLGLVFYCGHFFLSSAIFFVIYPGSSPSGTQPNFATC